MQLSYSCLELRLDRIWWYSPGCMVRQSINECRSNDCRSYECRRNNCQSNDYRSNETTPWHWSPLTQTSLLLSPSDGLASFLVFAITAAHLDLPKLPWRAPPPTPVRLVKEWILMLLIKKQLIWKLFIYWHLRLMSFFHKKNVTKCLGHHYAIWTSD